MTDVKLAKKNGEEHLKEEISIMKQSFVYEETAYHLPISFALTGIAVHDPKTALDVFLKTNNNPIVASECLLAEKTIIDGKESLPFTGFIGILSSANWDIPLLTGVYSVLHWSLVNPKVKGVPPQSVVNFRKNICSPSLPGMSSPL